jgi:hypothetical protein
MYQLPTSRDIVVKQTLLNYVLNKAAGETVQPRDNQMSNIGNQVVAVVATLLGFIAHDFLSETNTVPAIDTNMVVAAANVDPVVTRSVNMESLSVEFVETVAVAPAAMPGAPASGHTIRTAAVKFDDIESAFASVNNVRGNGIPVETSVSGYIR